MIVNPGQPDIEPEYAELADIVINFEGPYEDYGPLRVPAWTERFPREKFWHLVHTAPDASMMREVLDEAPGRHAGIIYVTDALMPNPWDRLASYWPEQLALLDIERPTPA